MSTARHHAEWLSLLDVSGPFLSMPVLLQVFPHGLHPHDPDLFRALRQTHESWADNQQGLTPDPAIHSAWVRFILREVLGYPDAMLSEGAAIPESLKATVEEQRETIRPDLVLRRADRNEQARLLIHILPATQHLEKPLAGAHWKASPATRMSELLRASGVSLGVVTNGEHWMLVHAPPGETTTFASWYASIWLEEKMTLRSFRTLLELARFYGVAEDETLEQLFAQSAANQQEVTDQLGYQVRQAVEMLVQTIDRLDKDTGRTLLRDTPEPVLYEAALTVMMRLVFLFCAEERGLLRLGDELYDQYYAVSTLRGMLREAADQLGEEVLERRHDAWCRLLATFRVVHGGVQHHELSMPAYGGSLFDPDRYPFLEGRDWGSGIGDRGSGIGDQGSGIGDQGSGIGDRKSRAPDPRPQTPDPMPHAPDPRPQTPDPRPQAPDPRPQAPDPRPPADGGQPHGVAPAGSLADIAHQSTGRWPCRTAPPLFPCAGY
jgi:hypothetical protein